jgi:ribosomal protein L11 methyltransferase
MSHYYRLRISNVPSSQEDLVTALCFEAGASGVSESLAFAQPREDFEAEILPQSSHTLDVFFDRAPSRAFIDQVREYCPDAVAELQTEPHKDWMEEWKKGFEPFSLVGEVWIVPSWRPVPAEALVPIRIDPGMAFGSGTHHTTQLAARLLWGLGDLSSRSVLDVGTGSGILALVASCRGAAVVDATEIDPTAREVARGNFASNQRPRIRMLELQVEDVCDVYDIVVANIIDGVLIRLQDHLKRCVGPRGDLLLTGVLEERRSIFEREFAHEGFHLVARESLGEWWGYHLRKL